MIPEHAGRHQIYITKTMSIVPDKTISVTVNLTNGKTETLNVTVPADKVSKKLIADTVQITFGTNNIVAFTIHD